MAKQEKRVNSEYPTLSIPDHLRSHYEMIAAICRQKMREFLDVRLYKTQLPDEVIRHPRTYYRGFLYRLEIIEHALTHGSVTYLEVLRVIRKKVKRVNLFLLAEEYQKIAAHCEEHKSEKR